VEVAVSNAAADNQPVVYIGDASRSVLTLKLINQTNRSLKLKGAAAVPSDMDETNSIAAVYLDFQNLLNPNDLAGLSMSVGTDWRANFFAHTKLWGFCPSTDFIWPPNTPVSITISKFVVAKGTGNAPLDVYCLNFDQPAQQFRELRLLVQNPPGDKAIANITAGVIDPVLITAPNTPAIQNTIDLYLVNSQGEPLESGSSSAFYLSFVYGIAPGYGALMPFGSATPEVDNTAPGGDGWDIRPDTTRKTPLWTLRPTGKVILGTGAKDTATFSISGITVPSDFVAGPTTLYVQWSNLPRYRDGHTQVTLHKQIPAPFISLQTKDFVEYGTKPVLRWQTQAIPFLQLSYPAYGKGIVYLPGDDTKLLPLQCADSVELANGFIVPDPIRENTTFYLTGFRDAPLPGQQATGPSIARTSYTVTVQHPLPILGDFQATPSMWPFELGAASVTLTWNLNWIETSGDRSLTIDGPGGQSYPIPEITQTSYVIPNVKEPQKWVLRAKGVDGRVSQAEAEIKTQSTIDYLYHPPRKYKGKTITSGTVPIHNTVEVVLSDPKRNVVNSTIEYQGLDQPLKDSKEFAAEFGDGTFVIPDSGGNPENTLHFRITPGALILADKPSAGTFGIPTILYEEKP
jgi:hypothetical protein